MRTFPAELNGLAWESTKSMSWGTKIQKSGSGKVRTLTTQLLPNWTIETKFQILDDEQYRKLLGFVALVKGAHEPFYWLDPEDYQEKGIQLSGTAGSYQAVMKLGDYVESVEKIDNVAVYVDGTKQAANTYTVTNGIIKFKTAPGSMAKVTADYRYYWKVMFSDDGMNVERKYLNINSSKSFKLEVVR